MIKNTRRFAIFAALAVYIIWGFSFLLSAVVQKITTPLVLLAYRFDTAALIMVLPIIVGKRKLVFRGKNIKGLLLLGVFEPCLYFVGEQYGVRYTNSAFSGIMIAMIPIITMILSVLFLKERPKFIQWMFALLSMVGIIVIVLVENAGGTVSVRGILFLLEAVITGAVFIVMSRRLSIDFSVYERSLAIHFAGAVFFTALAVIENWGNMEAIIEPLLHTDVILAILFLAIFSSVIGYILYNYAITNASVTLVAVMTNLSTVVSVIAGVVFMGDSFSTISIIAIFAVLIGIIGVQKS